MKIKSVSLYEYAELSPEAKKKALEKWNETNDDPLMQSHMINVLKEKLDERSIKYDTDSIDVRYSLSSCQGDGFMFIGKVKYGTLEVEIKHGGGRYYHEYSADFDYLNDEPSEKEMADFEVMYRSICKEMERIGYDEIEYAESAENFENVCNANKYLFRKDGTLESLEKV